MPQKVYNNVEGHRLIDNMQTVEDVTSVSIPSVDHPTTTISASGMIADVEMPNTTHVNAMELTVSHNNGINCSRLADPGKHNLEVRIVRQKYNVTLAEIEHESVKYRFTAIHKGSEKGTIETGNPLGGTEKFSVLRMEEEIDGEITVLIDAMAGIIKINKQDLSDIIEQLLK